MSQTMIQEFDPDLGDPAPGNRKFNDDDVEDLHKSMSRDGQLVPGIGSKHPTDPKRHIRVAGNRRARVCQLLGIKWRAEFIDRVLTPKEYTKIRVGENVHRKNPRPFELCEDVSAFMQEGGFKTWAEVAAELSLSPATICRITSVNRYAPEEREKLECVVPAVCWLIAPLLPGVRQQAIEFATAVGQNGRLPSRDEVARFIARFKKKPPGPKVKTLKGKIDGRKMTLAILPDESTDEVMEFLRSLATRMGKYRDLAPADLGFLFGSSSTA
jgi:ParB/RepB/Spo0J family partition protein